MRRRLALLLCAAVAATCAALTPTSASAAVTDGGSLTAGVRTTASFAAPDDEVTYSLSAPAGARPSLRFEVPQPFSTAFVTLVWADGSSTSGFFGGTASGAFMELSPAGDDTVQQTGTLHMRGGVAGSVSFVLSYAQDLTVPLRSGEATTLHFTDPGQQARLTFDASSGSRVHLSVTADALARSGPEPDTFYRRLTIWLTPQFSVFQEGTTPGSYSPETLFADGPAAVLVDPGLDLTGDVTLLATIVPAGTPTLGYDAPPSTVTIGGSAPASAAFVSRSGRPTVVQAVSPSLVRDDGSQGSAAVVLDLPGSGTVPLGTVAGSTVAFTTTQPLAADLVSFLRVVPDGTTTGSVGLRVFLQKDPAVPVTVGVPNPITVAVGSGEGRFSFHADAGDDLALYLQDVTVSVPDPAPGLGVKVEDSVGGVYGETSLFSGGGATSFVAPAADTYTLVVTLPDTVSLNGTLFPVLTTTTSRRVAIGFDDVVGTTTPGEILTLTVPRSAGDSLVADVAPMSPDANAFVSLAPADGFAFPSLLGPDGDVFLEAGAIGADGDWTLTIDPAGASTVQVRVRLTDQTVTTGPLSPTGTPTKVAITDRGGIARFTFDGATGDPLMLDLGEVTRTGGTGSDSFAVDVRRPDGSSFASTSLQPGSGPVWLEVPSGLDADGTWSVIVDPTNAATGTFMITRRAPRLLTGTIAAGTVRTVNLPEPGDVQRLTFAGRAGQRPTLSFSDRTVATRIRLIRADGLVLSDTSAFDTSSYLEMPELPTSGTWTLEIDPFGRDTGSVGVLLGLVTDTVTRVRPGATTTVRFRLGENPRLQLPVVVGAHVAVDLRSVAPEGTRVNVYLLRPDGTIAEGQNVAAGGWVEVRDAADIAGRWTVVLDPEGAAVGSAGVATYASGDLVVAGRISRSTTVQVTTPAQNVALPFRGRRTTTGQVVRWSLTRSTFDLLTVRLVAPDGTTYASDLIGGGDRTGVLPAPPDLRGSWQLVLDPAEGRTGRATVLFTVGTQ